MIHSLRALLDAFPLAPIQLMLRLGIGLLFWRSGLTKVVTNEAGDLPAFPPALAAGTVDLFTTEYKVPLLPPELAATLAASGELVLPVFLVLGLFGRFAAAGLLAMTLVIQWVYPSNWAEHLFWAGALLLILSRGPGTLSLDALIWRR
ncbi:DoxX family protein [Ferrovibrio sp.]|uniref:DoxX family protein n=1 Tax=Ferrovibrio sp. TaxID=1917215 RepID=UPI001B531422|nr:DoxX family protein [Ferrovibrio sp.]MBP7063491.1 DoxX family protein [Ferrovibrio sp.]